MDLLLKPFLIIDRHGCRLECHGDHHSWSNNDSKYTVRFGTQSEAEEYIQTVHKTEPSITKSFPEVIRVMEVIHD